MSVFARPIDACFQSHRHRLIPRLIDTPFQIRCVSSPTGFSFRRWNSRGDIEKTTRMGIDIPCSSRDGNDNLAHPNHPRNHCLRIWYAMRVGCCSCAALLVSFLTVTVFFFSTLIVRALSTTIVQISTTTTGRRRALSTIIVCDDRESTQGSET